MRLRLLLVLALISCSTHKATSNGDGDAGVNLDSGGSEAGVTHGLSITPSTYDFGMVAVGDQATSTFMLHNGGTSAVQLSAVMFTGPAASDYDATAGSDGGVIDGGLATTIAAGEDYAFTVVLQPSAEGTRAATLTVSSSGGETSASVTGTSACPKASPVYFDRPGVASACGKPLFIAVGNQTRRMISTDGKTWTNQLDDRTDPNSMVSGCTTCDDDAFQAAFANGLIVTGSESGIYTSADGGASWKKAPAPAPVGIVAGGGPHVAAVAYGNGTFLVANGENTYTSSDGYTWKMTADNNPSGCGQMGRGALVFGNGHFFAICGIGGYRKTSEDGLKWHDIVANTTNPYVDAVFGNGTFLAVGSGFHATSDDGSTWTTTKDTCTNPSTYAGPASACLGALTHVAFDGTTFLACGSNGCYTSTDTTTWTKVYSSSLSNLLTAGNGLYIANQFSQYLLTTTPTKWPASMPFPNTTDIERVMFGYVLK